MPSYEPPPMLFALTEIPPGQQAPASAIMTGPLSMIMENVPDSVARSDAIRRLDMARLEDVAISNAQKATRAIMAGAFADSVAQLGRRLDALERKRAERRRRADAEREAAEQQQIADHLAGLPDPDAVDPFAPTADLHVAPASEPAHEMQLRAGADQGDLPEELREGAPAPIGSDPKFSMAELAHPQTPPQQPVAISLNTDDD